MNPELLRNGFTYRDLSLPPEVPDLIQTKNFQLLDLVMGKFLESGSAFWDQLQSLSSFDHLEYILSLRQGEDDCDGIWHDDGSRHLAFSLSLNLSTPQIHGGALGFRKKGQKSKTLFPPWPYGGVLIFLTGHHNFEHKVYAVTKGERLVLAGWCSNIL